VAKQDVNLGLIEGCAAYTTIYIFDASLRFSLGTISMIVVAGEGLPETCLQNGDMPKSPFPTGGAGVIG
jgi:hypothetical protein